MFGRDIFREIEFPWPIRTMLLQHHERLDGSGYPAGLRGDQIIREARIIAVADMLEALTSHRAYRPAFSDDVAMDMLRQEKGRLDPAIVDCCLTLIDNRTLKLH
ncbi:MAG: hypothetical protein RLZZ385_1303 [Pseudomonadota bacterium]